MTELLVSAKRGARSGSGSAGSRAGGQVKIRTTPVLVTLPAKQPHLRPAYRVFAAGALRCLCAPLRDVGGRLLLFVGPRVVTYPIHSDNSRSAAQAPSHCLTKAACQLFLFQRNRSNMQMLYPLDVLKTRQQLDSSKNPPGMVQTFKNIVKQEG